MTPTMANALLGVTNIHAETMTIHGPGDLFGLYSGSQMPGKYRHNPSELMFDGGRDINTAL